MGIVNEDIARVRAATDIVSVISEHTQLRKVGRQWSGLCPFHNEKSPSFSVNPIEGVYYCFGCQKSGDVITFVREIDHLDFVAAVETLAAKAGITLTYTEQDEGESRRRRNYLHDVLAKSVAWYHERLLTGRDAGPARSYLRSRGFDKDMVAEFQVGWAPDSWDELVKHLRVADDVLVDCGLGMRNKADRQQDFFRGRILFPIFDDQGRPVAFGGRKLPDTDGPKYQNSRENAVYNKSATLYGLNWAKTDIVQANEAVVCEGYTDVIGFFRAGVPRAVATCGTALTEDHIRSLKRFSKRIVLAYDADEAGQSASERVYAWEDRHEVEFHVLGLPKGSDPDELSRSDPEALRAAVAAAKPFLGFRVSRVLDAADVSTPEGRARAAAAAVDVVREHPSAFMRDQYLMEIAGFCRVDEQQLRVQLAGPPRAKPEAVVRAEQRAARNQQRQTGDAPLLGDGDPGPGEYDDPYASSSPTQGPIEDTAELEALRILVHRPAEIEPWLHGVLFADQRIRSTYEMLIATADLRTAIDEATPGMSRLLSRIAVTDTEAAWDDVVGRLLAETTARAIASMEAEARRSDDPLAYAPQITWLKLRFDELRGDDSTMESADQLLAWLTEHSEEFS